MVRTVHPKADDRHSGLCKRAARCVTPGFFAQAQWENTYTDPPAVSESELPDALPVIVLPSRLECIVTPVEFVVTVPASVDVAVVALPFTVVRTLKVML